MTKRELYPIAEYCIRKGLKNTKDGLWSVPLKEIKKVFGTTYTGTKEQNEENFDWSSIEIIKSIFSQAIVLFFLGRIAISA